METAIDFANVLSAGMSGQTPAEYVKGQNFVLDRLDLIAEKVKELTVTDEAGYDRAMNYKSGLSGLYCYTFNNNLPQFDRVSELENEVGRKMAKWVKSQLAPSDINLMIRYLLWNRRFVGDMAIRRAIVNRLIEEEYIGYVFDTDGRPKLVVHGIYCKVGDNVFNGRNRCYVDVCCRQAFELHAVDEEYAKPLAKPLSGNFSITWMGDGKGRARHPKFSYKEWQRLEKLMENSSSTTVVA